MMSFPARHNPRLVIWTIVATGITSVTVQLLTLRECITLFQGNEIVIALVLFSWLLMCGLGSLLNRYFSGPGVTGYALFMLAVGVWPLAQLILMRVLRENLFGHGASSGFVGAFLFVLCLIGPYCLLVGFVLPHAQQVLQSFGKPFGAGDLYLVDSIGDILGGVVFSFFLVYWLKPFGTLALTSAPLLTLGICLLAVNGRTALSAAGLALTAAFLVTALGADAERRSLRGQYGDIVRYEESPYGRVVVSREGGQYTVWESGLPVYSGSDLIRSEEKVHFALSQLNRVDRVLLVSGGLGETLDEIGKYGSPRIDYVELDPALIRAATDVGIFEQRPELTIVYSDGRRHIRRTTQMYDAILIDLPDPSTFHINRFFTAEFMGEARERLRPGGILATSMAYSPHFIGRVRAEKLSTLYRTLRSHFRTVAAVPGQEVYFLCRDGPVTLDIPERLEALGIDTSYVAGTYRGNVTEDRRAGLRRILNAAGAVNRDFEPNLMGIVFREWIAKYGVSPIPFAAGFGVLLALYLFFLKREEYVLFATGAATMGAEMLVVFTFQVLYGYVYLRVGAIVAVFLLGLLPGALAGRRLANRGRGLILLSEILILSLLVLFAVWSYSLRVDPGPAAFFAYGLAFSLLCGLQFPVAAAMVGESRSPAAGCLAADLCGAAAATLAVGVFLIPFLGIAQAAAALILVKISSSMVSMSIRTPGSRVC